MVRISMNGLLECWRSEIRAPENRYLWAALACSFGLHILLMLFTSGAGRSDGVSLFPPSAARSAPILLMASFAEFRRASVSEPAEPHTSEVPEPLAQIQESPASIAPTIMQEVPKETRPPDRHGAANSSGSPESSARAEAVSTAARPSASAEQARADEEAARLARHASYGLASLLDVPPVPLSDIQPEYPESAGNQQGTVVLRLFISASGDVDELFVVRALPSGFFEEAALTAFASARFSPGMHHGRAVKSQMAVEVQFVPFNRGAGVSGRGY